MKQITKFAPRLLGVLILIILVAPGAFAISQPPGITGVEIRPSENQIELTTQGSIEFGFFPLADPDRLVFDFPAAIMSVNGGNTVTRDVKDAYFNQFRLSQFSKDPPIARLVIFLTQPAKAQANYSVKDSKLVITVIPENSKPLPKTVEPASATKEEIKTDLIKTPNTQGAYSLAAGKDDITISFTGINTENISVKQLRFPDRLRIRMLTAGSIGDVLPRFNQKDKGNIWNGVAKRWVSYVDRDNLGVIDLTIYTYPDIKYSQIINADGLPEVHISKDEPGTDLLEDNIAPAVANSEINPPAEVDVYAKNGTSAAESVVQESAENTSSIKPGEVATIKSVESVEKIDNGAFLGKEPSEIGTTKESDIVKAGDNGEIPEVKPEPPKVPEAFLPVCPTAHSDEPSCDPIFLRVGEVMVLRAKNLVRASVGNPAVAVINIISTDQVLLTALAKGTTTIVLWESGKGYTIREVTVLDATAAREDEIEAVLNDPNIAVTIAMTGDTPGIVLEGSVLSEEERLRAGAIAALYAGGDTRVTNLLEVSNPRQVMVKVRVVEMDKHALDEHLSKFAAAARADNGDFTIGLITDMLDPDNPGGGLLDTRVKPGIVNGNVKDVIFDPIDAMLNELETNREATILSEPNVIAMSGHQAHFRVGGEIPYTYKNENGFNVVEFKEFGIVLDMKPDVDSQGNIKMNIAPTVRTIDNALAIAGIPGFRTREMKTDVQMKPGETLVIGGLIQNEVTKVVSEIPLLSQIPVLGQLFRSKRFINDETELVILLTPTIINDPDDAAEAVDIHPGEIAEAE
jgi:pilus assembly protein CpaC